jgi:hypothetical protein
MKRSISELTERVLLSDKKFSISAAVVVFALLVGLGLEIGLRFLSACIFSLLIVLSISCTAFVTIKVLIPKFLLHRKGKQYIAYYIILSILFIRVVAGITELLLSDVLKIMTVDASVFGTVQYFVLAFFAFVISDVTFFRIKMKEEAAHKEKLANEKDNLEMRVLKSQINTHFLHNALNNIYSMIYFGDKDNAAKYVTKLSQMLRYVLDDCEANKVPISKEISYIRNYIDFQKARFETEKDIVFKYVQNDDGEIQIPPMIFQPLIENCFKHCPLQNDGGFIHIEIILERRQIRFMSENTKHAIRQPAGRNGGGIGVENLESRLTLTFKDNYSLNISDEDPIYRTELIINL